MQNYDSTYLPGELLDEVEAEDSEFEYRYLPGRDLSLTELRAGFADGSIEFWRNDGTGHGWYRCRVSTTQEIKGVPAEVVVDADDEQQESRAGWTHRIRMIFGGLLQR